MGVLSLIWRLPAKIVNSATSSLSSKLWICQGDTKKSSQRRRPLHTCGTSCLTITQKALAKMQDLNMPTGSFAKRAIFICNNLCHFIHPVVNKSLALLVVMDDRILAIENRIESIIPLSAYLFDGVDELVCLAEALPENLDNAMRKFPLIVHKFPLLDWLVIRLISWLSFLLWILINLGSRDAREKEKEKEKEKEITVDFDDNHTKSNAKEHMKLVQFEQPYSCEDVARNNGQVQKSVHFDDEREVIKVVPTEVIHLSVKRLHSWKSRIKALEEPLTAGDSPMYSSYQSANTSPVSDCSQDENHPFSQQGYTYKEILEKDKKKEENEHEHEHEHEQEQEQEKEQEKEREEEVVHIEEIREQVLNSN